MGNCVLTHKAPSSNSGKNSFPKNLAEKNVTAMNEKAIIDTILTVAGYTYGPLLGLFALGLFSKIQLKDHLVPLVCIIAPVLTYLMNWFFNYLKMPYKTGPELIIYNGIITLLLLLLIRKNSPVKA